MWRSIAPSRAEEDAAERGMGGATMTETCPGINDEMSPSVAGRPHSEAQAQSAVLRVPQQSRRTWCLGTAPTEPIPWT